MMMLNKYLYFVRSYLHIKLKGCIPFVFDQLTGPLEEMLIVAQSLKKKGQKG